MVAVAMTMAMTVGDGNDYDDCDDYDDDYGDGC